MTINTHEQAATPPEHGPFTLWASETTYTTLSEVVEAGRAAMDPDVLEFLEGGAGDEVTLHRNREAFARWSFRPRVMSGRPVPSTATTFLGIPLSLPVLTAPFGGDRLFHPDGHVAVACANASEGVASIVPELGSSALEDLATAAPAAARVAQLHPMGPPDNFVAILGRILRRRFSPDHSVARGNYRRGGHRRARRRGARHHGTGRGGGRGRRPAPARPRRQRRADADGAGHVADRRSPPLAGDRPQRPRPLAEAATAWEALDCRWPAACARWRQAEALLAAGVGRNQAAPPLRQAWTTAGSLDARLLSAEVASLGRRSRIELAPAPNPPDGMALEDTRDSGLRRLGLTPRETEVLGLVADGRTNRQIAETLFISHKTASVHVSNILAKLGVANRTEAAITAHRLGATRQR